MLAVFSMSAMVASAITPDELSKRQCSSVHLRHAPIERNTQAIYLTVKPLESAHGTYFCAANMDNSYIGFQEIGPNRKVLIFSVWDPIARGDDPNAIPENERVQCVEQHKNAEIARFGGEGTGGRSLLAYPWNIGETMQFLVINKPIDEQFKELRGYFFNNHSKQWELITAWKTHRRDGELSYAVSFIEDFRRNYESTKHVRKAEFGPGFSWNAQAGWQPFTSATFTKDPTPSEHIAASALPDKQAFSLQTGGNTQMGEFKVWASQSLPKEAIKQQEPPKSVQELVKTTLGTQPTK